VASPSLVVVEHWPIVFPELPRTPQQVVSESGSVGGGAGGDPGIGSTIGCGNLHLERMLDL
jgi:hypothetical protein